jgi:hypothetical protein
MHNLTAAAQLLPLKQKSRCFPFVFLFLLFCLFGSDSCHALAGVNGRFLNRFPAAGIWFGLAALSPQVTASNLHLVVRSPHL